MMERVIIVAIVVIVIITAIVLALVIVIERNVNEPEGKPWNSWLSWGTCIRAGYISYNPKLLVSQLIPCIILPM